MKTLAAALVLLAVALPLRAQTFAKDLIAQSATLQKKIDGSKLNTAFKTDFKKKLETAMTAADCQLMQNIYNCAKAAPAGIQKAESALSMLSDAVDAAIAKDGAKTPLQLLTPAIDALTKKVNASKLELADKNAILNQLNEFRLSLSQPLLGKSVDSYQTSLDAINADVDAAIALHASGTTVHAAYTKALTALNAKLKDSKLNPALIAGFGAKIAAVDGADGKCISAVKAGAGIKIPGTAAASATCPLDPTKAQAGIDQFAQIGDDIAAAVKADGSKSQAELYAPKIAALKTKLDAGNVDLTDLSPLDHQISTFESDLKLRAVAGGPLGGAGDAGNAATRFQAISDNVDAAVALAKTKGTFAQNLDKQEKALDAKIVASSLTAPIKSDFRAKASQAVMGLVCSGKPCLTATPAKFEAAGETLTQLSAAVDAAIKADGAKSLSQIYQPKLDALKKKLDASNVSPANKAPLTGRISDFSRAVAAPSKEMTLLTGKILTVEVADAALEKLSDDVDAAIDLSKKSVPTK